MKRSISAIVVGGVALVSSLAVAAPAGAAAPAPDLVVTDVSWSPQAVAAGAQVTFKATIRNRGTGATPRGVVHGVGFRTPDGTTVTWSDSRTSSLAPGQSVTVTANGGRAGATWTAAAGTTAITAYVDDARRIGESNERNNTRTEQVAATAGFRTTLQDYSPVVTAPADGRATGVANQLTGDGYAACFTDDGHVEVPGTEQRLGSYSAGNTEYGYSGPFAGNGDVLVPASRTATRVVGAPIDLGEILRNAYGDPVYGMSCPEGSTGSFTHLHATKLVSHRYALDAGGNPSKLLGTHTEQLDVDLDF
ncbi:CARDB domain-containing protein [Kineococcus arenarius]|uniref:CARDB domain-containing protein n=1 Tax=Kineococcus sp. SYSU DK007 TaxID=3383128 RepID=UPI003D7CE4E4